MSSYRILRFISIAWNCCDRAKVLLNDAKSNTIESNRLLCDNKCDRKILFVATVLATKEQATTVNNLLIPRERNTSTNVRAPENTIDRGLWNNESGRGSNVNWSRSLRHRTKNDPSAVIARPLRGNMTVDSVEGKARSTERARSNACRSRERERQKMTKWSLIFTRGDIHFRTRRKVHTLYIRWPIIIVALMIVASNV